MRPAEEASSWFRGKLFFWVPILPLVALDLWSKAAAFSYVAANHAPRTPVEYRRVVPVWENGVVDFDLVTWRNTGTIWGLGKDYNTALVVLRCLALLLLVWLAARSSRRERLQQFVLSLIFAGAVGNLYDNLVMPDGAVRDFLSFTFHLPLLENPYPFPAFNVADSCICVGAITLALLIWRADGPRDATAG